MHLVKNCQIFYGRCMRSIILFDLDGTLLDTSPGIFATANHTMEVLGMKTLPASQLRKFVGPPLAACFRVACGLEESIIPKACEIYRAKYANDGAMFQAQVYAGIPGLLEKLKGQGISLGVATLKLEPLAATILEHFGLSQYFSIVSGADLAGTLSKADIITSALSRLGETDLEHVLMVGDTPHDLDGAVAVGVDFVGVDWGFGFSRGHEAPPVEHVLGMIDEPSALLQYV